MSDLSKSSRKSMKEKAQRLAAPNTSDIDASGWREPTMNTNAKTGMRPISRRAFKKGGKVDGEKGIAHAGRKPRKAGGRSEDIGTSIINRDQKKANEERGYPHVGGYKKGGNAKRKGFDIGGTPYGGAALPGMPQGKGSGVERRVMGMKKGGKAHGKGCECKMCGGGRAKRAEGGPANLPIKKGPTPKSFWSYQSDTPTPNSPPEGSKMSQSDWESLSPGMRREIHRSAAKGRKAGGKSGNATGGTRPTGDRIAKARGGKTGKGKTNIVIAINPAGMGGQQPQAAMPPPPPPPAGVPMPTPMPAGPMGAAPMPMPAGMNGPAGPMPMGRNAGGRTGKMIGGPMMGNAGPRMDMPPPSSMGMPPGAMGAGPRMDMPMRPGVGSPGMGMPMVMRKSGGKVGHRSYKNSSDLDAGSGSGLGRLEKVEIQKKS